MPQDPNGLYGTQEAVGKASFPPKPIKKRVFPTFPGFGGFGGGPPWPPVDLLWALCGPIGAYSPCLGSNARVTCGCGHVDDIIMLALHSKKLLVTK